MPALPLSPTADRARAGVRHEPRRRSLTVHSRTALSDAYLRLTLVGEALAGFDAPGPDDHVKLFIPTEGGIVGRHYTPAAFRDRGESGLEELDAELVLHGDSGPASAWASRARAGDTVEIGGPRGSRLAPAGFRDALLIADPTGLPALRRWMLAFAAATPVRALLFGDDAPRLVDALEAEAPPAAGVARIEPVVDDALESIVRDAAVSTDTFVWAAGEAGVLKPVRAYLKRELGLPAANRSLHGYWQRGTAAFDHHAPLDPTDPD